MSSLWKLLILLIVVLVAATAAYQLWLKPQAEVPVAVAVRTATVTAGPLERVVRLGGVTSSIHYVNIRAPRQRGERSAMILLTLMESGAKVKKGDVVARIDDRALKDHIDDVQATVRTSIADVKKRRAEQEVDWSNLEQNIRIAKANWEKWKLEAATAEVRTLIDKELLTLGVEESHANYMALRKDLPAKKKSQAAEIRILELTTDRHKRHVARHVHDLHRYTVIAPMDGMVVRQKIWRGGEMAMVEQGDQVRSGMLFLKVMDTDHMQVEASVNQAESSLFRIGQEARIGLDAFPGVQFKGKIYSIGALAKGGRQNHYVRKIPVRIHIQGSDPRLIPDLSAYADVVVERVENVNQVPLSAVHQAGGESFVYVKHGDGFEKRAVKLGLRSYTRAAVLSGLKTGEVVALDVPLS